MCGRLELGIKLVIVAALLVLGSPGHALAWRWEGHRIVAEIAGQYLEPETARQVRELLAMDNATTLAEVSTWADDIRGQRREIARWHYVNIPIHPPAGTPAGYDAARDCPRGDCVVAKIDELAAELRDKAAPPRDRLEALKFVIHFVADVHQPLHAADDGDRGGNDTHLIFLGQHTCPYQKLRSTVLMVQATEDGHRNDPPDPVNRSVNWGVFVQRQVSPELVVISDVACDDAAEVNLAEHDEIDTPAGLSRSAVRRIRSAKVIAELSANHGCPCS